ncbi:Winged helix DNA-binding domain-containing protein [Prauserella salsuginis]|nr:Winged helix DNA-binding domain-containing protein [Prauserella salsuginis]
MTTAERRARLAWRHFLSAPADSVAAIAEGVVAFHATDPASVYLAAAARLAESGPGGHAVDAVGAVEHALYEDRSVLRMLGMRRTMFVVGRGVAPLVQAGCAVDIERKQRRLLLRHLEQTGIPHLDRWLADDLVRRPRRRRLGPPVERRGHRGRGRDAAAGGRRRRTDGTGGGRGRTAHATVVQLAARRRGRAALPDPGGTGTECGRRASGVTG